VWVESFGRFAAKPRQWEIRARTLASYGLVHVERGSGWFESTASGRIDVPPRSLLVLFPDLPHSYAPTQWWEEQWMLFGGDVVTAFEQQGLLTRDKPLIELGNDRAIPRQLSSVREALEAGGPLAVALAGARVHELLVLAQGVRAGLRGDRTDAAVCAAIELIDAAAGRAPTPLELATELGVGYSTLRRRFRESTGFSLKEYMLRAQLRRAKHLLAYTALPVEAVAERAGFQDAFYFARIFRSREGVPPSQYRARGERGSAAIAVADMQERTLD